MNQRSEGGDDAGDGRSGRGNPAVRPGCRQTRGADRGRRPGRGRAGAVHQRAGRFLPDQPGDRGQGDQRAGRWRAAGEAAGHRDVRRDRGAEEAAGPAPGGIRAAVRRAAADRGGPPRDRRGRAVRPDQGSRQRAGRRLAVTPAISVTGLTRKYPDDTALHDINIAISGGTITGLLGRNGAGKTTLLRILAAQEFPSSGSVRVLGAPPAENEDVLRRVMLVREDQAYPDIKVGQALRAASWFRPNWDSALASSLLDDFGLRAGKAVKKLSRGQRSALGITIGLAARAEVTLFDEPYAGLDAVARQVFYDRLLADFAEFPRTVLLSTHLIDEAAALFEGVIVIDRGRVILDAPADVLRGVATRVSGPSLAVDALAGGRPVWERRRLGSQASVVIVGPLSADDREHARSSGLDLTPLSLQQIVVQAAAGILAPAPQTGFETERASA